MEPNQPPQLNRPVKDGSGRRSRRINEILYDAAGRTTRTIQNYDDGGVEETDTDKDITVDYQYDSGGRLVTMTAYDAKGSGNGVQEQATKYLYTSAVNASWQTAVVYPDSTDTLSQDATTLVWTITAGSDHASTAYDQLGRATETTDQRGVVHDYTFDSAGRLSADTASDLGSSGIVDGSIRRIGTTYDDLGRIQTVTSYSDTAGTAIVNQVQDLYDGWGNLVEEWQSHSGAVDVQTTPSVQYVYDDGASGGVAKYVRLTDVIYPNGRDVKYSYGQTQPIDDIMSRLASIGDGTNTYAAYKYLGAGKIVTEDYQEASVKLDYSANNLASLDRFGRVADQVWASYGANPATLDEYDYGYDRAGNRTSRANAVDSALSEMYGYNGVDELTSWSVNGVQQRTWSLDALGNDLSSGTYSAANEETPTQGSSAYDLAGNMTTLQSGKTAMYDAWNRMTEVDDGSTIVQKNAYDGTKRRIQTLSDFTGSTPATVDDDYLAGQQVIESDVTTSGTRDGGYQYVWSPRYIDAAILRDTLTTDGTGIVQAERVFYLSDANFNVTGLVKYDTGSGQWQVAERYTYDPYGVVTYRNADWTTAASSANSNRILYTGRMLDLPTSLYYYRARYYDAAMERFIARDVTGYDGGLNLYVYVQQNPIANLDPLGLDDVTTVYKDYGGSYHDVWAALPPEDIGYCQAQFTMTAIRETRKWKKVRNCVCVTGWAYLVDVDVTYRCHAKITITLPRWTDYSSGTPAEQQAWDAFITALDAHENGHADIDSTFNGTRTFHGTGFACTLGEATKDAEDGASKNAKAWYDATLLKIQWENWIYDLISPGPALPEVP